MKKNKLIEILNKIEGNPDILLYNGFVDDWMDIEVETEPRTLVKETVEFWLSRYIYEYVGRHNEQPSESLKEEWLEKIKLKRKCSEWEFPNEFVQEEDFECWYGKRYKKVHLINAKLRGKNDRGRGCDLEY